MQGKFRLINLVDYGDIKFLQSFLQIKLNLEEKTGFININFLCNIVLVITSLC
jgi:hypothetical protein